MTKLKEQLAQLSEGERLTIARELLLSLSDSTIQLHVGEIFADLFRVKKPDTLEESENLSGEEMKAWIREQIALSESAYADKMKNGEVKTYSLQELKAQFDG